ncbi:2-dehydro-3-deoxy-6-phosphogalactonate aldolase [Phenylobacterium sp. LH3H17]|uniref:2-dehydro-3-deoxy-6-phosphogalactonate aldolase n=1 Tax=Phenylobacterium sp. LH3H17 TaxID=2903901 RepID=UPI0020C9CB4D|nr:2-dehydro-3-deoxy-6-phosphogalactonate aldolase [Phenylobacterium sp. LH3H17]UTP40546.1 2-dehydro-3-deoxy-6-phosphogalactonate aldolase [Phenylobacterium sp. LH3H17]
MTLDEALAQCPVVAILRGIGSSEACDHVAALFEAGVRVVEVPLNSPEPLASIGQIARRFGEAMIVGAGTVLNQDQVDAVAAAGGRLIVSPNSSANVIARALALRLDPIPGFASATEAFSAIDAGARHLKLFPAVTYGPGHLTQLRAVLPAESLVWAVGGVSAQNLSEWSAAGALAFGLGGELYRAGQSVLETAARAARAVSAASALS